MKKKYNLYLKWLRMLLGKSNLHVKQGPGRIYSKEDIRGYYNDLTLIADWRNGEVDSEGLPINMNEKGVKLYNPTAIAQFGLGNYDLYLLTCKDVYYRQFINSVNWMIEDQHQFGGWDVFERLGSKTMYKYSAMTQGQGASLLIRAYKEINDDEYLAKAHNAIKLMLLPVEKGGTARYCNEKLFLEETVESMPVLILNGWIFAIFGLYDITKIVPDAKYKYALEKTIDTLKVELRKYDSAYWSYYDQCGRLASPCYHNLHIALLDVLYDLFNIEEFKIVRDKWDYYLKSNYNKGKAFIIKAYQKIKDPGEIIIVK